MTDLKKEILLNLKIDLTTSVCFKNKYYWVGGCKYVLFQDDNVNCCDLLDVLDIIGQDCSDYPLNSYYLVIVIAPTMENFDQKDLYFQRGLTEHVAFVLYNTHNNCIVYPTGLVFPPRFSFQKTIKKIVQILFQTLETLK